MRQWGLAQGCTEDKTGTENPLNPGNFTKVSEHPDTQIPRVLRMISSDHIALIGDPICRPSSSLMALVSSLAAWAPQPPGR